MGRQKIIGSDIAIKNLKPPATGRVMYGVKQEPSLYLQVTAKRTLTWYLVTKGLDGKPKRHNLGRYLDDAAAHPDDQRGTSLKAAIEQARTIKAEIKAGVDHAARALAEAKRQKDTFGEVRERFMRVYAVQLKPSTQTQYKTALWHKKLKGWDTLPVHTITRAQVREALQDIFSEAPVMANRVLAYLRKFFNWCAEVELIKDDEMIPTNRVKAPLRVERARTRFLSEDEIKVFWRALEGLEYPYRDFYKMLLLTGQRCSNVAQLRWSDIDGSAAQWMQSENKADRATIVPLNKSALTALQSLPKFRGDYIFTTTDGEKPINGLKKAKQRLDSAIKSLVEKENIKGVFVDAWVNHDLRRTMTTHLRRAKFSRHVCGKLLNHAERGVTANHYDMYDMLDEKTQAMTAWGVIVERITATKTDSVVPLRETA